MRSNTDHRSAIRARSIAAREGCRTADPRAEAVDAVGSAATARLPFGVAGRGAPARQTRSAEPERRGGRGAVPGGGAQVAPPIGAPKRGVVARYALRAPAFRRRRARPPSGVFGDRWAGAAEEEGGAGALRGAIARCGQVRRRGGRSTTWGVGIFHRESVRRAQRIQDFSSPAACGSIAIPAGALRLSWGKSF